MLYGDRTVTATHNTLAVKSRLRKDDRTGWIFLAAGRKNINDNAGHRQVEVALFNIVGRCLAERDSPERSTS